MNELIKEHLDSRCFNAGIYSAVWLDKSCLTVGLWNLSGKLVGYQKYDYLNGKERKKNPKDMRYFTYTTSEGSSGSLAVFGTELLDSNKKYLFIAEGIFDVSPLHNRSVNALAVLSNDPKHLKNWLSSSGYHIVALCEGDAAGKRLGKYADTVINLPEGCDPADMPSEWFDELADMYGG